MKKALRNFLSDNKGLIISNAIYFGILTVLSCFGIFSTVGNTGYPVIGIMLLLWSSMLFYIPVYAIASVIKTKKILLPNILLFVFLSIHLIFVYGSQIYVGSGRGWGSLVGVCMKISFFPSLISTGISAITKFIMNKRSERHEKTENLD